MSKPKINKNIQIPDDILRELLTDSEIRMLKNRWQIKNLLKDGLSVRVIAEKVKVGTDTVVRVAKMVKGKGKNQQIKSSARKIKTSTPWIFGKSD